MLGLPAGVQHRKAACGLQETQLETSFRLLCSAVRGFSVCAGHVLLQVPVVHLQAILLSLFFLKALKF